LQEHTTKVPTNDRLALGALLDDLHRVIYRLEKPLCSGRRAF